MKKLTYLLNFSCARIVNFFYEPLNAADALVLKRQQRKHAPCSEIGTA